MTFLARYSGHLGAFAVAMLPIMATAQDQPAETFQLELNAAAETSAGTCRLTFVASNQSEKAFDRTAYSVGVFDSDGAVTRLLVLEFGALVAGKTKIVQFDLPETPCTSISRILVSDVAACTEAGQTTDSPFCMDALAASSRTAIQFGI